MKTLVWILVWPFWAGFQGVFILVDGVVSFIILFFGAFGFSRPGILTVVQFGTIVLLSFLLAALANSYMANRWSDLARLTTPVLIQSGTVQLDELDLSYGFELRDSNEDTRSAITGNMGSFLKVASEETELFEIRFEAERRKLETGRWLDPETCFSLYMTLPSRSQLRETIEDQTLQAAFNDRQDIYEICEFGFPFSNVSEVQISLDRLSLLELIKQEFDNAVAAGTSTAQQDAEEESVALVESAAETAALSDLTEGRRIEVRDIYIGQFLSTRGVLAVIDTQEAPTPSRLETAVAACIEDETVAEGVCARFEELLAYVSGSRRDGTDVDVSRCGQFDSVYHRICGAQSAMFTNGRIQFVTLVVFFFGLLQLSLVFLIGVATPFWMRLAAARGPSKAPLLGTAARPVISTKRFTQLYPDLVAPITAAIEILPMIGFFGTIIGISGAMTEVAGVKSSDKIIELLSLGSMTTNIGVAFETTKFALILTAILLFLKLLTDRLQALSSDGV